VLGDLVGGEVALVPHGPYQGYNLRVFWGILLLDKFLVIVVDMSPFTSLTTALANCFASGC
jgi:hypothetical protein